jgi:hypothetical protein
MAMMEMQARLTGRTRDDFFVDEDERSPTRFRPRFIFLILFLQLLMLDQSNNLGSFKCCLFGVCALYLTSSNET